MMKGLTQAYRTHITSMGATELPFLCMEIDRYELPANIQKDRYVWNANFSSSFIKMEVCLYALLNANMLHAIFQGHWT